MPQSANIIVSLTLLMKISDEHRSPPGHLRATQTHVQENPYLAARVQVFDR